MTRPFRRGLSDDLFDDLKDGPCATVFRACVEERAPPVFCVSFAAFPFRFRLRNPGAGFAAWPRHSPCRATMGSRREAW